MTRFLTLVLLLAAFAIAASFCFIILDEREQGFRSLLGNSETIAVLNDPVILQVPGIYLRIPGLHQIDRYDRRLQTFERSNVTVNLGDKVEIDIDYYLTYQIVDPQRLRQKLGSRQVSDQLSRVSQSKVRDVLGQHLLSEVLSEQREAIMRRMAEACNEEMLPFGVEISDLRIRTTDYPESNLVEVFRRMQTERDRTAKRLRAEGQADANRIRSAADLETERILAEARRESEGIRGRADSEATSVYAEAYGKDPEFYSFLRSLEAYKASLDDKTTLVLSPDVPFLKHLFRDTAK